MQTGVFVGPEFVDGGVALRGEVDVVVERRDLFDGGEGIFGVRGEQRFLGRVRWGVLRGGDVAEVGAQTGVEAVG